MSSELPATGCINHHNASAHHVNCHAAAAAAAANVLMLMCPLQALKVLKEMQQRKAFTSLLGVSLAEAGKTNDKTQAAQMRSLDLSMHIASGTLPDAWVVGHQVSEPGLPLYITSPACTTYSARQSSHAAILYHTTMMFRKVPLGHMIN